MLSGLFIGILLGFILQRSQFCFVSGFRNIFYQRQFRFLTALLIAVSIQSVGLFLLAHFQLIEIPQTTLPVIATLVGGFVFGAGMSIAGCCASGGWFRGGEGAVGSLIALVCFSLTMAATQTGMLKSWVMPWVQQTSSWDNIYLTWQISPWVLVGLLIAVTVALVIYQIRHPRFQPATTYQKTGVVHWLFERRWHPYFGAVLLGGLGIIAWLFSAETGRNFGFGIAIPSANVMQYIVTGQQRYLNWGTYLVLGIIFGSFIAAKASGEFRLRMSDGKQFIQRVLGGVMMGIGAALAGGCTITNSLVATAYFSWQAWIATFMIMLGCWVASAIVKPTQCSL
ncbi:hypothetical protein AM202_02160 [Actinobacillus minor 202]|uniref:Inner membrane protein n=1 Tax=Actinobacillus minor 202 TaxID=591023 RepID=A0ABM9YUF7_9PAST|nr:YeeE/YedE family protein [Actinobacillus minor]EEV24990.1 hypothetical protein AM202_02160 [Actinobacillus minor 202]